MRGEVRFKAGEVEHSLRYTTNRLCALEGETGRSVMAFAEALSKPGAVSLSDVRLLLRAGLDCSDVQAGDIIDEIGLQGAVEVIGKGFAAAFDIDDKGKPTGGSGKK